MNNRDPTLDQNNSNNSSYSLNHQSCDTNEDDNDHDMTVWTSNTSSSKSSHHKQYANATTTSIVNENHGIRDAGATGTFCISKISGKQ